MAELLPSGGFEGELVPCLSLSLWWSPAALGVPWFVGASFQSLPLSAGGSVLSVSLLKTLVRLNFAHPNPV